MCCGRKRSDLMGGLEGLRSEKAVAFYLTEWNRKNLSNLNGRKESYEIAGGHRLQCAKVADLLRGKLFFPLLSHLLLLLYFTSHAKPFQILQTSFP